MKNLKRMLTLALGAVMILSAAACGGNENSKTTEAPVKTEESTKEDKPTPEPEPSEEATEASTEPAEPTAPEPRELSKEPLYHYTFDKPGEAYKTVVRSEDPGENTGAAFGIVESDKYIDRDGNEQAIDMQFVKGTVGNALYLDGNYGLKLDVEPLNTETYTLSFWLNAVRLGNYGPTLQMGSNIGMDDTENRVTWINITQTDWGTNNAQIFPVVWNRNSETTAWPWVYAADDKIHGKKEWVHITLVATGNEYTYQEDGLPRNGCKFYLDGKEVFNADASEGLYGGLATEIMKDEGNFEAYFGINYWDVILKAYVDDLYIFDYALSDGEVAHLYQLGDPSAVPEAVEVEEPEATEPEHRVVENINPDAIATVGSPNTDNAFWTSFTDGYELADGASLKFHFTNYSSGINNWDNYMFVFANTKTEADTIPSAENYEGYAEYGVLRADAYAWGFATEDGNVPSEFSWDWNDFMGIMAEADVTAEISRQGSEVKVDAKIVGPDGKEYTYAVTAPTTAESGDPMYVILSGEACYIELLSVE